MNYSFTRHISLFLCFGFALFIATTTHAQNAIFVNHAATGANDGTSWNDAFTFLQDALQVAQSGDEIWVAQGVYRPDQGAGVVPGDREASFRMQDGVSLYGGFTGLELLREQRNYDVNETILNGDLSEDDSDNVSYDEPTRSDNSMRVVRDWLPVSIRPTLDGFTISGGHGGFAAGISSNYAIELRNLIVRDNTADTGAGLFIYNSPEDSSIIDHIVFVNNEAESRGGGLSIGGHAEISNVVFKNNRAREFGGGIFNEGTLKIDRATFIGNSAEEGGGAKSAECDKIVIVNSVFIDNHAYSGGGYHQEECNYTQFTGATIVNSLFAGNHAVSGGAISSFANIIEVFNSTIVYNTASLQGGGVYHTVFLDSRIEFSNSILWGNTVIDIPNQIENTSPSDPASFLYSSLVEGEISSNVFADAFTIYSDPLFIDPLGQDGTAGTIDDNYRLAMGSPAIDAGASELLPADSLDLDQDGLLWEMLPVDLDMNVRVFDGGSGTATVDIGAYEYGAPPIVLANDRISEERPRRQKLVSNYPNPFSVSTTISYSVSTPSEITLEVYNILGKRVRVLEQGFKAAGEYEVTLSAEGLSTGVYFLQLTTGGFSQTTKMVLVR